MALSKLLLAGYSGGERVFRRERVADASHLHVSCGMRHELRFGNPSIRELHLTTSLFGFLKKSGLTSFLRNSMRSAGNFKEP
jgi:hypothetical protein